MRVFWLLACPRQSSTKATSTVQTQGQLVLTAATPKFEVKRPGTSGHSNNCVAVPLSGYSTSHFAGAAYLRRRKYGDNDGQRYRRPPGGFADERCPRHLGAFPAGGLRTGAHPRPC